MVMQTQCKAFVIVVGYESESSPGVPVDNGSREVLTSLVFEPRIKTLNSVY